VEKKGQSYLREVREQIKSKEAKDFVSAELDSHIRGAKHEWMKKGLDEAEAEEKAVGQMGNPVTLGQQLNKLHRPKVDWLTVILLVTTMGLGFIPILFVDPTYSSMLGLDASYFFKHKAIFAFLGGSVALGMMLLDYRKLAKLGWLFYGFGMFLLGILQISPYFRSGNSVMAIGTFWVDSLIAIPFFLLAWASFFYHKKLKLWQLSLVFLFSFLLFLETSNLPITYIYTVMVFGMFWWSRFSRKIKLAISGGIVGSLLVYGFIFLQFAYPYQKVRLLAFIDPENFAEGPGYIILLIQERMSKAGWFGNVLNSERIPDAHTDLVFVGFTYYFGWLAAIALVAILALLIVRILMIARSIQEPFGKLLVFGAVVLYTVQLVSNIGMTLGVFPITSISLPFISYGLMPTLFNAFLIGVVLSVYRRKDLVSGRSVQVTN
jgi:cell division protein FtsW (lipid II flippase)